MANLKRSEDTAIKELMKSLDVILGDFLRFHHQLLDNFFTLQRSQHPFIGPIVSTCGIAQMPWHSLYAFRFASSYQKLAKIMEGSKVRAGIFKRVMQVCMQFCHLFRDGIASLTRDTSDAEHGAWRA